MKGWRTTGWHFDWVIETTASKPKCLETCKIGTEAKQLDEESQNSDEVLLSIVVAWDLGCIGVPRRALHVRAGGCWCHEYDRPRRKSAAQLHICIGKYTVANSSTISVFQVFIPTVPYQQYSHKIRLSVIGDWRKKD